MRAYLRSASAHVLIAFLFAGICMPLLAMVGAEYSLGQEFDSLSLLLPLAVVFAILYSSSLFAQASKSLRVIALLMLSLGIAGVAFLVSSMMLFILWAQSAP